MKQLQEELKRDAEYLKSILSGEEDIYFLRSHGNMGDELIYTGSRELFKEIKIKYKEDTITNAISTNLSGEVALISGGGAWNRTWEDFMTTNIPYIANNFKHVIVLPSSFQMSAKIFDTLQIKNIQFMAREEESFNLIKNFCDAKLAHDHAFYFDFSPYIIEVAEELLLNAYRTDRERAGNEIPINNIDISALPLHPTQLYIWLLILKNHDIINTDRAHVMIAGAMMGKHVYWSESNYHKLRGIASYSLKEFKNVREK